MRRLGIDVGGTGVKGNVVDTETGELLADRVRIETPHPATPEAVADTVAAVVETHGYDGPVGITLPSVVKAGIAHTAANIDPTWPGTDAVTLFGERLGRLPDAQRSGAGPSRPVFVLNDADAAGLAEVRFGAGAGRRGVVCMLTIGTGIGSALFLDGRLLPSSEFGHLQVDGHDAESRASAAAREREELSWPKWAKRFSRYLQVLEDLVWPDLFILGGGVSKKPDKWLPLLEARTEIVVAQLQNQAGIVGAAMAAAEDTSP
ncbi:polyphosphate--glucose phosphotransferase [Actinomycetospora sp. NBRC 106378]|uniref:polyphosphate--glucose phosphotransferase n=1 Tax=Actinomycetospora sp. NBRC 106378 TaxID=3032208 RepID=UPI0025578F00|nr:ROK family protein [Actinomycetospora sp. NBRC 106378]